MDAVCLNGSPKYVGVIANSYEYKGPMRDPTIGYFHKKMSLVDIRDALTHLSIINNALKNGYETIWIMDEDVQIRCLPQEVLRCVKIANEQNQDWGLLYTDEGTRNESGKVLHRHKLFRRPDIPFDMDAMYLDRILLDEKPFDFTADSNFHVGLLVGAHSYLLNRHGMETILNYYKANKIFIPYEMEIQVIPGIVPYRTQEPLVSYTRKL